LLLDEVERIHTDDPVLRAYLDTVAELLAVRGHRLEVGQLSEALIGPAGLRRVDSRVVALSLPARLVGEMFGLNLTVWRDDPLVAEVTTPGILDEIAAGLRALARAGEPATITWHLRQLATERSRQVESRPVITPRPAASGASVTNGASPGAEPWVWATWDTLRW